MTKTCGSCRETKPVKEFSANRSKPDGLQSFCRACKKSYNADYYKRTKHIHNPSRAERRDREREAITLRIIGYLREHPCVDCGETDVIVLDFDHQRDKAMDINKMRSRHNWARILKEIEKCEVRCANCHRRRTAATQGWARARAATDALVAQR